MFNEHAAHVVVFSQPLLGLLFITFGELTEHRLYSKGLAPKTAVMITSLYFSNQARFPTLLARQLLQHMTVLHTFVFVHDAGCRDNILNMGELRAGLEHVSSTLETLTVLIGGGVEPGRWEAVSNGKSGSHKSFGALKNPKASFAVLYGQTEQQEHVMYDLSEMLPIQFEQLVIINDLYNTYPGDTPYFMNGI